MYNRFFKYICTSSLLGLGSAILADFLWYALSGGIHIIDLSFTEPMFFLTCWCLGGGAAWYEFDGTPGLSLKTII